MRTPPCRRRAGFTLLELLVVITVIAILVAILTPTLTRAKEHFYRAQCAHNMRQLHTLLTSSVDADLALPEADDWRPFVTERGAGSTLVCPKDAVQATVSQTLADLYFVQVDHNGQVRKSPHSAILGGSSASDGQLHYSKSGNVETIYWGGSANPCAKVEVVLGTPVTIRIPGYVSHEALNGNCNSRHYVCKGSSYNWTQDKLIELSGNNRPSPPITPFELFQEGSSYAMNVDVARRNPRPDQILLVEYENTLANVYGTGGQIADDWDDCLDTALRHLGRGNYLSVDGGVRSGTREYLEYERDHGTIWKP